MPDPQNAYTTKLHVSVSIRLDIQANRSIFFFLLLVMFINFY